MHRRCLLATVALVAAACHAAVEEPNTDLGLRVFAEVTPSAVSVRDTAAVLHLRVVIDNPSAHDIHVVSGGPPYKSTLDPVQTAGLGASLRFASATDPLHAGPWTDWFGQREYVFAAHRRMYEERTVRVAEWRRDGWPLAPGRLSVRAWFNGHEGQSAPLEFTP